MNEEQMKTIEKENMVHDLPLCKLPTVKRLVEDVGIEGEDLLADLVEQSTKAMSETAVLDLDMESKHIWKYILRTHKLLLSIHNEAVRQLHDRYVADAAAEAEEGGER